MKNLNLTSPSQKWGQCQIGTVETPKFTVETEFIFFISGSVMQIVSECLAANHSHFTEFKSKPIERIFISDWQNNQNNFMISKNLI